MDTAGRDGRHTREINFIFLDVKEKLMQIASETIFLLECEREKTFSRDRTQNLFCERDF